MPYSQCHVCFHPEVRAIDAAIRAGLSQRKVAAKFEVGRDSIQRHIANGHLAPAEGPAPQPLRERLATTDLEAIWALCDDLEARSAKAMSDTAWTALANSRRQAYVALHKAEEAAGHHVRRRIDLAKEPEWIELRQRLLHALEPFRDAHEAFLAAEARALASQTGPAGA
jgi:hypothetical protein